MVGEEAVNREEAAASSSTQVVGATAPQRVRTTSYNSSTTIVAPFSKDRADTVIVNRVSVSDLLRVQQFCVYVFLFFWGLFLSKSKSTVHKIPVIFSALSYSTIHPDPIFFLSKSKSTV